MALEVVGGAFLSASLQVLFADIHSITDFVRRNRVNEELLKQLRNKLLLANGALDDAERQQIAKSDVREWLEQLKDAIHDAEDLVDEIKTEALRCQLEADRQMGFRVRNFFPSRFAVRDVERRMENIIKSVDDIVEDMKRLGLRKGVQASIPFQIRRSSLNILAKESDVYGRDAEMEAIFRFLLSDGGHKISVMSIVGMGGIGKTTLAQIVYNMIDGKMKEVVGKPFVIKAWITVSDKSDVFTLTKAIYEKVTNSINCTVEEAFELQLKLKDVMEGKKFLFVLDDAWKVDYQTWINLQTSFESAANGSKIIVTTRLPIIATDLATVRSDVLDLQFLSEADCWKLFSKLAFHNLEPIWYRRLEEIGKKIVEKCKGNPLAVKSLACLLRSQINPNEWKNVLVNDIWDLDQSEGGILPALWLSYYYLPRHLKRCFVFCSIIPKGYPFEKEKLILLWMAENLLEPQNNTTLEEVGERYFEDLRSMSFFLVDEDNRFTMHDLVNDLAKYLAGESYLRLDNNCSGHSIRVTRHISCMSFDETSDISKQFEDLSKNKRLRTLLVQNNIPRHEVKKQYIINPEELQSMQYLRVLSASGHFFTFEGRKKLFKSIGSLKLLRYLDLSYTEIEKIPHSICKLYNLQTLLLRSCRNIAELPGFICSLNHLRHLDLSYSSITKIPDTVCNLRELRTLSLDYCEKLTRLPSNITRLSNLRNLNTFGTSLEEMPPNMSKLKNLQNLSEFVVGERNGIEELGFVSDLRGRLCIRSLENVEEVEDVSKVNLKNKNHITDLTLEWSDDSSDVSHNKAREVLHRLEPHTNIEQLRIENYGGGSFPYWIGQRSFFCIKILILHGCKYCDWLPLLGELPSLEDLKIEGFDMVERIGNEFYLKDSSSSSSSSCVTEQPFKSLERLRFSMMPEWKEWSSVDRAFTNLKELYLWHCPKLKEVCLPHIYLPSLEHLHMLDCHHLMASLSICRYPSLGFFEISICPGMKSFPQGRLPSSIQRIGIRGCDDLESLSEEGWPCSNLKSLEISRCDKLFAHSSKWNLGMLTSLTSLQINAVGMKGVDSFPEEEGQLPTTLTSLELDSLRNLKSLNGTALQHLTSLQTLWIRNCKQLQCFSHESLPASLSQLTINGCPLLNQRCHRKIGQDWHKICHIPRIKIDDELI